VVWLVSTGMHTEDKREMGKVMWSELSRMGVTQVFYWLQ
jgi:hypothetical protein